MTGEGWLVTVVNTVIVSILERISRDDSPGQLSEELIHRRKVSENKKQPLPMTVTCLFSSFD